MVTFGGFLEGKNVLWCGKYGILKEVTVVQLVRFYLNLFPGQDSNLGSLKYTAGVLTTAPYHWIIGNTRMSVGKGTEHHEVADSTPALHQIISHDHFCHSTLCNLHNWQKVVTVCNKASHLKWREEDPSTLEDEGTDSFKTSGWESITAQKTWIISCMHTVSHMLICSILMFFKSAAALTLTLWLTWNTSLNRSMYLWYSSFVAILPSSMMSPRNTTTCGCTW